MADKLSHKPLVFLNNFLNNSKCSFRGKKIKAAGITVFIAIGTRMRDQDPMLREKYPSHFRFSSYQMIHALVRYHHKVNAMLMRGSKIAQPPTRIKLLIFLRITCNHRISAQRTKHIINNRMLIPIERKRNPGFLYPIPL